MSETSSPRAKIKQLEWEQCWAGSNDDIRSWRPTNSIFSSSAFSIYMDGDSWEEGTCERGRYPDLVAAKAARQLQYEDRILSAFDGPLPLEVGKAGWRITENLLDPDISLNEAVRRLKILRSERNP